MQFDRVDVVVIGAGVSGLSTAWWLARAGVDVAVVEKGLVGWEASGRNGGGLGHRAMHPEVEPLARESLKLWPGMHELLGYPIEHVPGRISVALTEEDMATKVATVHAQCLKMGIPSEILDRETIRELVPVVSPEVAGGVLAGSEGKANPQRVVQSFAWALQDLGGRLYQHTMVTGFEVRGGKVVAVRTDRGDIATDFVISAAGPQTGILTEAVGTFVPVAPARVEMIVTAPIPLHYTGGFVGNGLYGRQTLRGNLAYGGGPHEWIDVDMSTPRKPNTPLIRNIARRLYELMPGAADVPVLRSWGGVVEQTPDLLPIIDVLPEPDNFMVVTVSGHGFGLSPATGKVASELMLHGESSVPIDTLRLGRFAGFDRNWRQERGWTPQPMEF